MPVAMYADALLGLKIACRLEGIQSAVRRQTLTCIHRVLMQAWEGVSPVYFTQYWKGGSTNKPFLLRATC